MREKRERGEIYKEKKGKKKGTTNFDQLAFKVQIIMR